MNRLILVTLLLVTMMYCHARLAYSDSLLQAARSGDPEAQCRLGCLYRFGEDDEENAFYPNYADAAHWWNLAAEQNNPEAIYNLAMYEDYISPDFLKRARYLRRSAEGGFAPANHELGMLYAQGLGVVYNPQRAIQYLTLSAQSGNPHSAFAIGQLLLEAPHGDDKVDGACLWFQIARLMSWNALVYEAGTYSPVGEYFTLLIDKAIKPLEQRLRPEELESIHARIQDWLCQFQNREEER